MTIDEVRSFVYNETVMLIHPDTVLEYYKNFTPQKFLYFAIHQPTQSVMACIVSRKHVPYAQELFEFLKGNNNTSIQDCKPHRTMTVMRLNMIFTLLKNPFNQMNATTFEDIIFKQSHTLAQYKERLLKTLQFQLDKYRQSGGYLPFTIGKSKSS